ncbi:MAG TPA: DUF1501 domain-containing protein [Planctomycetaceae bacterium]|nr:DUF1501 domain-containing protein [Planctomycetaceae bacterium]
MTSIRCNTSAHASHAFENFHGKTREGLVLQTRRGMLKAGVAGVAGLSLTDLLKSQAAAAAKKEASVTGKSVILLWMCGGPSQIDTWDMKPNRPLNNRGPFAPISTAVPGIQICEHLPKQAAMMDRFTLVRSVDCLKSSHQPNMVIQTGNREAAPRINPKGDRWPSFGSVISKFNGPNDPAMPPYVAFYKHPTHVGFSGYLGQQYDPFQGNDAAKLPIYDLVGNDTGQVSPGGVFQANGNLTTGRMQERQSLMRQLDFVRAEIDRSGAMHAWDVYQHKAADIVLGQKAHAAFDLTREDESIRNRYGKHLWCQQALLARRLVQSGVSFVTLDLSYHTASGTWDNHGDNIPPYGGISKGLKPLLPLFDHLITTLVDDLDQHGLLDNTLVIAMGEFGRTPDLGTQGSTDGRNHWPHVMSMCLAGGGLRHGQVIGATESDGGHIASRPVTPGDLAATIYRHMGVPLDATFEDDRGRPHYIVQENGKPLGELWS